MRTPPQSTRAAFTLPELMITLAIFSMLVVGMLSIQLFGLRLHRIAETKLSGTADGRRALNQVRNEIRTAKVMVVGTGDETSFSGVPEDEPRVGNALQVYPGTDTNTFLRFFLDGNEGSLKRYSSVDGSIQVMARFITNQVVFQAEDFRGNILTNDQNNRVIRLRLEFYRWEYPLAHAGDGAMYDYYRLQTRITRRLIE